MKLSKEVCKALSFSTEEYLVTAIMPFKLHFDTIAVIDIVVGFLNSDKRLIYDSIVLDNSCNLSKDISYFIESEIKNGNIKDFLYHYHNFAEI